MLGIFGRIGRARDLRHLDDELRAAGLHPALAPEAVKMTVIRLLKTAYGDPSPYIPDAAALVAYCSLGPGPFVEANDAERAEAVERRLREAVAQGDTLDAQMVLLTLHAEIIHSDVVDSFGLDVEG